MGGRDNEKPKILIKPLTSKHKMNQER